MIITLTPNPSLDRTVTLPGPLERGGVQRADSVTSQAGGKGINISRAAVSAGVPTLAVLPVLPDSWFVRDLAAAGIGAAVVATDSEPRVNLTISEPDGTTTKLNTPGPTLSVRQLDALTATLLQHAADAAWVVLAGSLPPGAPVEWYADLVAALDASPARVAVDTSDAPLQALVERLGAHCSPALMKPNGHELASFTGHDGDALESDPVAAAGAAQVLLERGVGEILVTLGGAGAVLVTPQGAWHATPPPTTVISTVGAGDSSLFGYLLGDLHQQDPAHRLARAVAYGSAAAGLPGTTIPEPAQVHPDRVQVRELTTTQGRSA